MCPQTHWTWAEVAVLTIVIVTVFAPPLWIFDRVWRTLNRARGSISLYDQIIHAVVGTVAIAGTLTVSWLLILYATQTANPSLLRLVRCM